MRCTAGTIHLVENVADAQRCRCASPETLAFVTQTTLSVDDTQAIVEALRAAISRAAGAARRGHLLRDAEPAGCGQAPAASTATCWWWWVRPPVPIPTGCANWPIAPACPAISSMGRTTCSAEWFAGRRAVGVTAGASAPEVLVQQVVRAAARLGRLGAAGRSSVARRTWCSACRRRCGFRVRVRSRQPQHRCGSAPDQLPAASAERRWPLSSIEPAGQERSGRSCRRFARAVP